MDWRQDFPQGRFLERLKVHAELKGSIVGTTTQASTSNIRIIVSFKEDGWKWSYKQHTQSFQFSTWQNIFIVTSLFLFEMTTEEYVR